MNLNIFYHQHAINDYQERFDNTYKKIVDSGLIKKINAIYLNTDINDNIKYPKVTYWYNEVRFRSESPTLMKLREYSFSDGYSLYLHSKGVSQPSWCENHYWPTLRNNVQDWINLMEYFLIYKHKLALEKLSNYNVVGVDYTNTPWDHFSGNFWFANNQYIRTLNFLSNNSERWKSEEWIGTGNILPYSLHQSNVDHYHNCYPPSNYS